MLDTGFSLPGGGGTTVLNLQLLRIFSLSAHSQSCPIHHMVIGYSVNNCIWDGGGGEG